MRDELVEFVFADEFLNVVEEREAFLVGNATECVVGIFAFEVDD